MTNGKPPAAWHFWADRLRQRAQAARRGWYALTLRCPQCRVRRPGHKFGCGRRPGRGERVYVRLEP